MNTAKVMSWSNKLDFSRKYPLSKEEINELWAPVKSDLSREEQISLLISLVKPSSSSVFRWLNLINYIMPELFKDDESFADLIDIIVERIKNDLAQGDFIRTLINNSERSPEEAIKLFMRLKNYKNESTIQYSGLVLGGAGKKSYEKAFALIKTGMISEDTSVIIAYIRALRVIFETKENDSKFTSEIFDFLDKLNESKDPFLRSEVISGYIDFERFDPERCKQRLTQLATNGDCEDKYVISSKLSFSNLSNNQTEVVIMNIFAESTDPIILNNLSRIIGRKGKNFSKESLDVIKKIFLNYKGYNTYEIDYNIEQFCKHDPKLCIATFDKWLKTEKGTIFNIRVSEIRDKIKFIYELQDA